MKICGYQWLTLIFTVFFTYGTYASTILFYASGDNNLSKRLLSDLIEIKSATISQNDKILIQLDFDSSDRSFVRSAKRAKLPKDIYKNTTRLEFNSGTVGSNFSEINVKIVDGEPNMDSVATFLDFLQWGKSKAEGKDISLIMWNHGHSILGFGGDEQNGTIKIPNHLTQESIKTALQIAKLKLDFLAFDTCLLGSINTFLQFNQITDLLIANPEVDYGPGFNYESFLPAAFRSENIDGFVEVDHSSWNAHHTQFMDELFKCHTTYRTINQSEHITLSTLLNNWVDSLNNLDTTHLAKVHNIRRDCVQYSIPDVTATEDITKFVDLLDLFESFEKQDLPSDLLESTFNLKEYILKNIILKVTHGYFDNWIDKDKRGISIYWPELSESSLNYFEEIKVKYEESFGSNGSLDKLFGESWVNFLTRLFELNNMAKPENFRPNQFKPRKITTKLPYGAIHLPFSEVPQDFAPYVKLLYNRSEETPAIHINYDASINNIVEHDNLPGIAGYTFGDISLLQYNNSRLVSKIHLGETYTRYLRNGSNAFDTDCKTYFIHSPNFEEIALPIDWHSAHDSGNWGYFPFRYGPDPENLDQFEHYLGICKQETLINGNTILELVDVLHNDTEGLSIKGHAEIEPGGWLFPEYLIETYSYDDEGNIVSGNKKLEAFENNFMYIFDNIYSEVWIGRENPAMHLHNIKIQDSREYYFVYELNSVSFSGEYLNPVYFLYSSGMQGFTTAPNPYLGLKISREGLIEYYSDQPERTIELFGKTNNTAWQLINVISTNRRGYFKYQIPEFTDAISSFYKVYHSEN